MPRHTALAALALVGLVVTGAAAGGGYAVADSLITSAQIKNGTIKGADVKKDALTGKQIKESKLGQVPSAATVANGSVTGASVKDGSLRALDVATLFVPDLPVEVGTIGAGACKDVVVDLGRGGDLSRATVLATPRYGSFSPVVHYQAAALGADPSLLNKVTLIACNTTNGQINEGSPIFSFTVLR